MRTLYISYFGLGEPLVQSQVLPYLRELVRGGIVPHLLTFEARRPSHAEGEQERSALLQQGVHWHWLRYHKTPSLPATVLDILAGALFAAWLARREKIAVLHARAHFALAMALLARPVSGSQLLFDLRGLVADEYVDAGIWTNGSWTFRAVKALERRGLETADGIVVLTEKLRALLVERGHAAADKIEVIPCCTDTSRFAAPTHKVSRGTQGQRFVVVYAGSVSGLYLLDEMVGFFKAMRELRPNAFLKILTGVPPQETYARLLRLGLTNDDCCVGAAAPTEVPRHLAEAQVGISFRKPTFSQIGASPTKIPEYLAAGIPVISNAGIGDSDAMIDEDRVGVVVTSLHALAYREAAHRLDDLLLDPGLQDRCRRTARTRFDVGEVGGVRYRRLYTRLRALAESGTNTGGTRPEPP